MKLVSRSHYSATVRKAREFSRALKGDAAYVDPAVNRIALQCCVLGWLMAQRRTALYERYCAKHHPRENIFLTAQDIALQAASDAIKPGDPAFTE